MRRSEKNTNKRKGAFLQSLASRGDVNTFQQSRQGRTATQISLGVFDCFSLATRCLECSPYVHRLGLGLLLTKDIIYPWEIKIFSLSLSSFCFQGSRWGGKQKRVAQRPSAPLNPATGKPCAGTLLKKEQCEITKLQLSAFSYPVFHLSCFCVEGKQITVSTHSPQHWVLSSSPVNVKTVPGWDYHHLEDGYCVKISWSIICTVGNELNWIWISLG